MASPAARASRPVYRSWSSAIVGIARRIEVSFLCVQSRDYSDEGMKDNFKQSGDHLENLSDSFDLPAIPVKDNSPSDTLGVQRTDHNRNAYSPRSNFSHGVCKAIVVGKVGQPPFQRILKSGKSVTIFAVGTGGMHNRRRLFQGESSEEFLQRSNTQWHRVAVYQDRVAGLVRQHVKVGSQVYLEGNVESRVYTDPASGRVKSIWEIAIRGNGRIVFMEAPVVNSKPQTKAQRPS